LPRYPQPILIEYDRPSPSSEQPTETRMQRARLLAGIDLSPHNARALCWAGGVVLMTALAAPLRADDALWSAHIEPLLKEHCVECHNPTKPKSGLDVSSLQTILRGGERGAAVIPGRPNDSNLYKFLTSDSDPHMPPAKRKALTEEEAGLIKKWIQDLPVVASAKAAEISTNWSATNYASASAATTRISWKPPTNMQPARVVDHFLEVAWK